MVTLINGITDKTQNEVNPKYPISTQLILKQVRKIQSKDALQPSNV